MSISQSLSNTQNNPLAELDRREGQIDKKSTRNAVITFFVCALLGVAVGLGVEQLADGLERELCVGISTLSGIATAGGGMLFMNWRKNKELKEIRIKRDDILKSDSPNRLLTVAGQGEDFIVMSSDNPSTQYVVVGVIHRVSLGELGFMGPPSHS